MRLTALVANGGLGGGDGGRIIWSGGDGGTPRVEVFGNGFLDFSFHPIPSVTIGSIEGSGLVFLGGDNLTVGSNNLSTTFSGVIQDGGVNGGTLGSFTKIGTGALTLSGANIYTGVTTVSAGTLLVNAKPSSGTGTHKMNVNAGTLGGTGTIGGAVTVGTGSGSGAFLSPGTTGIGTLTLKEALTFKADGTYKFELKSRTSKADKVTAKGVTITGAVRSSPLLVSAQARSRRAPFSPSSTIPRRQQLAAPLVTWPMGRSSPSAATAIKPATPAAPATI